jgi:PAS domain S-box-containing protein
VVGLKGGQRWMETHAVPLRDETGNIISLLGATRDISARKQAEQDHALLAAIVEYSDDAIISTTLDGIITSWNRGAEHLFSHTEAEATGQQISCLVPEVGSEEGCQILDKLIHRGEAGHYETQCQSKDSSLVSVAITVSAIKDKCGRLIGISRIVRDITLQKHAENVLIDARYRLEKQVTSSKLEVELIKEEVTGINIALDVLLKRRETDKSNAQAALSLEIENTILPFLKKLKEPNANQHQAVLLGMLENNLQQLMKSYGNTTNLSAAYQQLTPVETQVASMVRQKLSTKVIAASLNISIETVNTHRKHIRKKFGLDSKASSLHKYLMSLTE